MPWPPRRPEPVDTPEGLAAREHYATRWLAFAHDTAVIPIEVPMTRQRILDALFSAGAAEWHETHHA